MLVPPAGFLWPAILPVTVTVIADVRFSTREVLARLLLA